MRFIERETNPIENGDCSAYWIASSPPRGASSRNRSPWITVLINSWKKKKKKKKFTHEEKLWADNKQEGDSNSRQDFFWGGV